VNAIFLLGYMGCGKSTIGKSLAQKLNISFIDLDQVIENQENESIKAIFDKRGELYFRKAERQALQQLIAQQNSGVISLGGGTPCYFENMNDLAQSKHYSIYLKASIPTLVGRLKDEKVMRPMIDHLTDDAALTEFIGKHLFERNAFYQKAKTVFTIDGLSVDEIVDDLIKSLA